MQNKIVLYCPVIVARCDAKAVSQLARMFPKSAKTVVGVPSNAVFTFTPINPNLPVDFTPRVAGTFRTALIGARCGTPPQAFVPLLGCLC